MYKDDRNVWLYFFFFFLMLDKKNVYDNSMIYLYDTLFDSTESIFINHSPWTGLCVARLILFKIKSNLNFTCFKLPIC